MADAAPAVSQSNAGVTGPSGYVYGTPDDNTPAQQGGGVTGPSGYSYESTPPSAAPAEQPPPAPAPAGPSKARVASGALAKVIDDTTVAGGKIAGGLAVLADKAHSAFSGQEQTGMQDWWFKNIVDPYVQRQADNTLGPDASAGDRATYQVAYTAGQIAEYFAGVRLIGGGATLAERLAGGAGAMLPPAVSGAVSVGQSVLDATGNKMAAAKAASLSYVTSTIAGLVPVSAPGRFAVRAATGAAMGAGLEEIPRIAENTQLPKELQQPFDPLNFTVATITGGAMGGALGPRGEPNVQVAEVRPTAHEDVLTHAQQVAEHTVAAAGGDPLDGVVAATNVNAHLSAHHDAAATHGAREQEALDHANALQSHQAAAAEEAQQQLPLGEQQLPLPGMGEGGEQPAPGQGELPLNEPTQPGQQELLPLEQQSVLDRMKAERQPPTEAHEPGKEAPAPAIPPKEPAAPAPAGEAATAEATVKDRMAAIKAAAEGREQPPPAKPEGGEPTTLAERKAALSRWSDQRTVRERLAEAAQPPGTTRLYQGKDFRNPNSDFWTQDQGRAEGYGTGHYIDVTPQELEQHFTKSTGGPRDYEFTGTDRSILDRAQPLQAQGDTYEQGAAHAVAADIAARSGMSGDEATAHLQPILDRLPQAVRDRINIDDHVGADTVPMNLRQQASRYGHTNSLGVYDPQSHTIRIFAGAHDPAKPEDLTATLRHELKHFSNREVMGDDWERGMNAVFRTAGEPAKQWMSSYANEHHLDMSNPTHRATIGDEYATHLANGDLTGKLTPPELSAWGKLKDTIRQWGAKIGLGKYMSDDDIRDMVLHNQAATLRGARPDWDEHLQESPAVWSDQKRDDNLKNVASSFPEDHPNAQGARLAMTKEEQANYAPNVARKIKDAIDNSGYKGISGVLGATDMRHLPDYAPPEMKTPGEFLRLNDARRGRTGRMQQASDTRLKAWSKFANKNPDENSTLTTLMHASTLSGVDPSKPYESRWTPEELAADPAKVKADAEAQALHTRLQGLYDGKLSDQGRDLYNGVRDDYVAHRNATWKALEARINESAADPAAKQAALTTLRRTFEAGTVKGPYFPLARFGDYWTRAIDKDGNTQAFARWEKSKGDMESWTKEMKDRGFQVESGVKTNERTLMDRIDPNFVKTIMEVTKGDPGMQDDIWQAYLKSMPEMSMRKQFIHRQGRLGFTADAMRAYAFNSTHGAMQLGRLEYGARMDDAVRRMKGEATQIYSNNPSTWKGEMASRLADEFDKRNKWITNPENSPIASAINQLGFGWYLGFAPATAYRIHTQNSMLASPIMAAHFQGDDGFGASQVRATKELTRATLQWAKAKGDLRDTLRGDELKAFDDASDQGMFSNTWAATLAANANGRQLTGKWAQTRDAVMGASQWLFNAIEHKNRMTTYLASYRVGRQLGMDHEAAVQEANKVTWDAHLDYGNDNRARFLQSNVMKVAGQFRQYGLGVAYRLARDFHSSLGANKNLTPAETSMARKQFAGILVRSAMYAGAVGLPAAWIVEGAANLAFGSKDKPFDAREAAHSYLQKEMGRTAADAVMYGPVGATTGAALSSGASYSDLVYKTPQKWAEMTGLERALDAVQQMLGPVPGAIFNVLAGVTQAGRNPELAMEHFVPPAAQGVLKAAHYARSGAQDIHGNQIMTPEEMGNGWSRHLGIPSEAIRDKNLFLQSMGLTPQVLSDRRQQAGVMREIQQEIKARKGDILSRLSDTVAAHGDTKPNLDELNAFNKAQPAAAVNPSASVLANMKSRARMKNGVALDPKLENQIRQQYGGGQ